MPVHVLERDPSNADFIAWQSASHRGARSLFRAKRIVTPIMALFYSKHGCKLVQKETMTRQSIAGISPFFIVTDVPAALRFYCEKLRFEVTFQEPADDPDFAIVQRDTAMIMLKDVDVAPLPNCERHPWARWDAYLYVPEPDSLAEEFESRGVSFSVPLKDTEDGLRGFELRDSDGYVLFFGRPQLP